MGRKVRSRDSWRAKVHPLFIEAVRLFHEDDEAAARGESVEDRTRKFLAEAEELRRRYPTRPASAQVQPYDVIYANLPAPDQTTQSDVAKGRFEMLAWEKLRRPLRQLAVDARRGDRMAERQLLPLMSDYVSLRDGKKKPKHKADAAHSFLLMNGLGFGLEDLTPEELADCFDKLCRCGTEHDSDSLKHQRARFQKAIQLAVDSAQAKF